MNKHVDTLELENTGQLFPPESPRVVPQAENPPETGEKPAIKFKAKKSRTAPEDELVDFSWDDEDAIALNEQRETATYLNRNGDLVIRQRTWPDDDHIIIISANNVYDFLDRITDIAGIPSAGRD